MAASGSDKVVTHAAITPLILTLNEGPNIQRTLEKLNWAKRIVVIDSGSTDDTLRIVATFPQAEVFYRPFDTFAAQCNFGLCKIESDWVLSLDADYDLSDELVDEIKELPNFQLYDGFRTAFVYRIYGRALRGTLYPPRCVLYRTKQGRYVDQGHGHKVIISGKIGDLRGRIYHDDRKSLSVWIKSQAKYARQEAEYLLTTQSEALSNVDKLRRAGWPAPFLVILYTLVIKQCLLDGWSGWFYTLQRFIAESLIALEVIDQKLRKNSDKYSNHFRQRR